MANRPPYQTLQATTPQTIGYALTDSPVGQLAWIAERFAQWNDPRSPISDERMLTNISLYWLTATAASSARLHHDSPRRIEPCPVPVGVAVFAHDITQSVRPLAERLYDIRHWSEFDRGGHFAAMEVPKLLAQDVRDFFLTRIKHDQQVVTRREAAGRGLPGTQELRRQEAVRPHRVQLHGRALGTDTANG